MDGYTIKSVSSEGTYYLAKNWRKNKIIWAEEGKLRQEYLYSSMAHAITGLEKLLNVMDDYATDKFSVVVIADDSMLDCGELVVENMSETRWSPNYKAKRKGV